MGFGERLQHAWNAFINKDPPVYSFDWGTSYATKPDIPRFSIGGNEKSIITAIYNRIAVDVSQISFQHVRLDENGRYKENIESGLNRCMNLYANKDQTGRELIQDIVISLCDEGCVAVVPVDTDVDIESGTFKIDTLRVGKIKEWWPDRVRVELFNDRIGQKADVVLPKKSIAIIENPFYTIMNEPNSTLRRLIRKLNLLDAIDEQSGSGRLDIIIQLPYTVRTEQRRKQAIERVKDIEMQLKSSKYGIAYADATEHITQLNRPVENNLMTQIEYLTKMLYNQLGLTEEIMNGTATDAIQLNYYNHTIEPFCSAIANSFRWKFLTSTARTQGQTVMFFQDPFRLVPVTQIAEIADKLTRNEILTSNEVRSIIGYKPVDDPKADELRNSNINQRDDQNSQQVQIEDVEPGSQSKSESAVMRALSKM